ncbi:MAG TPA: BLUF domain-containing protein [Azospirillum sp.]
MFLSRLVYYSHATAIGDADVTDILTKSHANNYLLNITGALFYNGRWFVQVLEGGRNAVSEMFVRIGRDTRHRDVNLLEFTRIDERSFPEWSMRYIGGGVEPEAVIRRYMPAEFDPSLIADGVVATRLLRDLVTVTPAGE